MITADFLMDIKRIYMGNCVTKKYNKITKNYFEQDAWVRGNLVCGIDEVGRGCLAGPVVVAAVVLNPGATHDLLRDSKVLSSVQRAEVFPWIIEHSTYAIASMSNHEIDTLNIYQATLKAMGKAYEGLYEKLGGKQPLLRWIVVDAMPLLIPQSLASAQLEVACFIKGESYSTSIAAASIVAKETRDALMIELDAVYPAYGFAEHKGYATKQHREAITRLGQLPIHRKTFLKMFDPKACIGQESIFQAGE